MKKLFFMAGAFLTLSSTSQAAPPGGGFHGGSFHGGFVAHSAHPAFGIGHGIRRNFAFHRDFAFHQNRRFFDHDRRVFLQQFAWPVYWYPYYDPLAYSYLEPDHDYQYWDNSASTAQSESFKRGVDNKPTVILINIGNSRTMDSRSTNGSVNRGYGSTDAGGEQRIVMRDPNEKIAPQADPVTFVPPAVPQPTQTVAKATQITPPARAGAFGNLVLVSWLKDGGKDMIYVQNTETNDVQKITSEPNLDNFRIVELHPNADPKLFEAIISNGNQQGPVRFRF